MLQPITLRFSNLLRASIHRHLYKIVHLLKTLIDANADQKGYNVARSGYTLKN